MGFFAALEDASDCNFLYGPMAKVAKDSSGVSTIAKATVPALMQSTQLVCMPSCLYFDLSSAMQVTLMALSLTDRVVYERR